MAERYFIRRDFVDIAPFLDAIRAQADSERDALGFLPEPAYAEAARQRKLILLISQKGPKYSYAGHLLFGGIFPVLRVRQIAITAKARRNGHATTLLRALTAQGEKEGYLSVVANVATDLLGANSFYERNGFLSVRFKAGGKTRNRMINVRIFQLQTPSLISLMVGPNQPRAIEILQPKKRTPDIPIYAIDLNVFYDAIRKRTRSDDAGVVFEAALNAPEALRRGAVVENLGTLTKSKRVLATTFDNLVAFRKPVTLRKLRQIGCVTKANFVSATPISAIHLAAIVDAGCSDD